ncbi:TonB-linked SusC/RagA family outer membrane protein [Dysgonomonas alginatilytica]|uniref:TonB-linked SusC/RagA family outer membrane protein n=2 Tax=Dysgonomonas alginatilytica TaxID=1605892 RepID=A0A2V3PMF3_9BACT|nr:TonB-linked SusC/RagA family outer membrane protein [Dysgonomonas alginatilytica]
MSLEKGQSLLFNIYSLRKKVLTTLIFTFFIISSLASQNYEQNTKLDLNLSDATLGEAIKTIEKQTDFVFFYNNSEIDLTKRVDINIRNGTLKEVLSKIFSGYSYRIENKKIVLLAKKDDQPTEKITGKVIDPSGEAIIGASLLVRGQSTGTITDIDGNFNIDAAKGAKVQVSYLGFQPKEFTVGADKNYTIALEENPQLLNEVVVVGYGVEKKVNVIGSIAQITSDKLENRSTPQLSNALTGQMSGVTVIQNSGKPGDSSGKIRIRGVGSFGATPDALVLIDGIPGSLNDLNSEDVESISVLKDASTAAIYGARAANGVILVTTKIGKQTGADGKVAISYNGYLGFNKATQLPQFVNSWEYATLYNEAVGREEYTADVIQKLKDGSDPDNYANSHYLREILDNKGFQTGHDVTLNGGSSANKYMISFGYLSQDGIIEKNNYSRYNGRANIVNQISPKLILTTRLSGMYSKREEPNVPGGDDAEGMVGIIQKAVRFPGLYPSILSDGSNGPGPEQHGTPISWINSDSFYENPKFSANANLRLDYKPIKDLQLAAIGAYTYSNDEERGFKSTMKLAGGRVMGPSELRHMMDKTTYKTFQATADYNKTVQKNQFGLLVGYSWEQEDYRKVQGTRDKFPGNDLPYLNAGSPDNQTATGTAYGWALQSFFGRFKYNFDERYLFESTIRYDGSSRFPKDSKYGLFPSVAGGWRISEENFIKENGNLDWLSSLKLKASWGKLGNQNIGNYPYQTRFGLGQNYPFGDNFTQGAAVITATDPTIRWEATQTIDGGLESIFWNGLLSFNANYFHRKTTDILYQPSGSVSSILGQKVSVTNTGKLKNTGWEFEIGHRNKIGQVTYNINGNLSIINNKVLSLGVGNIQQLNGMVGNGSDLFIGHPMQLYYGYRSDGVFLDQADIDSWYDQSKVTPKPQAGDIRYKDISGPDGVPDGVIDPEYDRVPLGSQIPNYTFGLNIGVEYKGLDFSMLIQGVSGVEGFLQGYAGFAIWSGGNIQRWQADERFDPKNPIRYPKYPRIESLGNTIGPNTQTSDFWILDASYVRVRNLQLGYTIPKNILDKMKIAGMRFYIQAENPLTWKKYREGWDPEISTDGSYYPILETYTFGINLKF